MVSSSSVVVVVVDIFSFFGSGSCGGGDLVGSVSGFSIFSGVTGTCRCYVRTSLEQLFRLFAKPFQIYGLPSLYPDKTLQRDLFFFFFFKENP